MRNIILADNQDIARAGWQYLIATFNPLLRVSIVANKVELVTSLIDHPDSLVVLDYTLFDFESVNDLLILQMRYTKVNWILFSDELSDEFIRTLVFNSNFFSVLMKDSSVEELISSLKEGLKGNRYIGNSVSNLLLDSAKSTSVINYKQVLTITEQEILKEMAMGRTTKEIASIRFVSAHTIMTHRKNIFRKIEVNNVHEATKYAMRAGIVDMAEYYI
jgi:two-component system, NarL family, response regulator LiaR